MSRQIRHNLLKSLRPAHGYVKRVGEPASLSDLNQAFDYWRNYQETHKISPEQEEQS